MKLFKLPEINKEKILRLLPSKRFGFYLLIVLSVPIFAFIFFSRGGVVARVASLINGTKTPKELAALQAKAVQDTDSDGLDDWQEALWKTDFKNPDTDGDGTKDGEEVRSNRNPNIAGPGDTFEETIEALNKNLASTAGGNLTEELSKNILTKYITTKKVLGGTKVTPEIKTEIQNAVLAETDLKNEPTKLFTTADFKTTSDNSITALRKYANEVGKVAISYATRVDPMNDMGVVKDAIQYNNKEALSALSKSIAVYNETEKSVLSIVVPSSLQAKHLAMLNTFYRIKTNTEDSMVYFSDPMRAIIAIGKQGAEIKNLIDSFVSLNNNFESAGILFKDSEPGFFIQNNVNNLPK